MAEGTDKPTSRQEKESRKRTRRRGSHERTRRSKAWTRRELCRRPVWDWLQLPVGPLGLALIGFWLSMQPKGNLNFHWRTLCLPPRIVEYVVVHELVHIVEPHHGSGFWRRVERVIPDFAERKRWLAESGDSTSQKTSTNLSKEESCVRTSLGIRKDS
jgi:hypothetical protein